MLSRLQVLFFSCGVGTYEGRYVRAVGGSCTPLYPVLYPAHLKEGPKQSKSVLFKNSVGNVSPLLSKLLPHGTKRLMMILSLARLPIPPHRPIDYQALRQTSAV